ncbi:MAG: TetR family transcriptional regulator [Mycobacterium sp.]
MLSQARAEATRRRIVDVATELFKKSGFSGTPLNQIIRKADVTPGAFYYHFGSKDDVAFAIISEVAEQMDALRKAFLDVPGTGLENVIAMTFQLSVRLGEDSSFWVAAYLEHTMARHTEQGLHDVAERVQVFIDAIAETLPPGELREGVTPQAAAVTMFTLVYGCLAMTDLVRGHIANRLYESFRALLPGLAARDSLPHLERVLSEMLTRYERPVVDG